MNSITDLLKSLELEQYAQLLIDNHVDLKTLQILTDDDLKELGLPFGPRKRLLSALSESRQPQGRQQQTKLPDESAPAAGAEGERRQLTVLFCDMVGFTEIAHRVDPEVLQTIIRSYEDACSECITRYEGYVFQCLGDGIVAFFGYPLAHEGEAARAIRAGLDILETMTQLEVPEVSRLRVRVGIATGIVVVATGERGAVGETMNLAARLQGIAEPGWIAVSERVRRLAGGEFIYDDMGEHSLKGISHPTRVYRVVRLGTAESRFDAATQEGLTPLVGRAHELNVLLERWQWVQQHGAGVAVVVSGEPGIGKSRIMSALRARVASQVARPLRFQCSPFYVNSPFYPIITAIERALEFSADESPESKLEKLVEAVVGKCGLPKDDVRFLAAMLSLPYEERYGAIEMAPRLAKRETIRVLVDLVGATSRRQPNLVLFEDGHWADPSTLDVLNALIDQLEQMPLLLIITNRPEAGSRWAERGNITSISITRLTPAQSRAVIYGLTGGKVLPAPLVEQIIKKADGIPLFVEELTKTILESGDIIDQDGKYVYAGTFSSVTIPDSLRDSLMARLDRVATVKNVAQVGAVIGREFSYEIMAALNTMSDHALADALSRLTSLGLVFSEHSIPQAVYTFKHALVQDAAYDSLLKSQRKLLHGKIARVLEQHWRETEEVEPELLAHHYTAAGQGDAAVPFWRRAGEAAMERFALPEAITHLREGLRLLATQPQTPERDLMELELRTLLGPPIVAQLGWGHEEVSNILEPAWAIAERLEHRPAYLPILNALWVHTMSIGQLGLSLRWAEKLLAAGANSNDDSLEIAGHRAASASYFWMGDFVAARRHGDMVESMYDGDRHWHIAQLTNTDPLTGEGIYRTQYLWMLGHPDQAVKASDAKDQHARRRNHPFDLAFALTLGAQVFDFRREPDELRRRTEEAERVGRQYGVALLSEMMAEISRGIILLHAGRAAESVAQLDEAITRLRGTGHRIWLSYLAAVQAEAIAQTGDLQGAAALIDKSLEQVEGGEERAHYAEMLRLKGWLLAKQGEIEAAERTLRKAIDVARSQQAKSWELRATTTLARLLAERGDESSARAMLADICGWFTEGFETHDVREAKGLLDNLQMTAEIAS
jgi:class 3 adenylate cyclase/tetratricopeptide (TPR) repeat protein